MSRESVWVRSVLSEAQNRNECILPCSDSELQRLRRATRKGIVVSPVRGVFVGAAHWSSLKPRQRVLLVMNGLQAVHPNWVFVGPSAAVVQGLWVSNQDLLPIRIASSWKAHGLSRGVVFRQLADNDNVTRVGNLRCSELTQAAYDCLREMDFAHGLAIADSALRVGGLSKEALVSSLEKLGRKRRGSLHVMETASHADCRAQSGGESMSRARIMCLGYELPELQVELENLVDGGAYYADFGWMRKHRCWLIGELDGHEKYLNPEMTKGASAIEVLSKERLRESRITALRIPVMRFSFSDILDDRRFTKILDAYEVPRSAVVSYKALGQPFVPAGIDEARRRARDR